MKNRFAKIFSFISRFKYVIVIVIGVLIVGFVDDNSFYHRFQNRRKIAELEASIKKYRSMHKRDSVHIKALENDPDAIKKLARERYFMKENDEDVFILSDEDKNADGEE